MADGVEVKLGADASGIKSGMGDAASAVREKLAAIGDYLKRVSADGKNTEAELTKVLDKIKAGFERSADASAASSKKMSTSFLAIGGAAGVAMAVVGASVAAAVAGIGDLKEEAGSVEKLVRAFGMTSDEASRMNVALTLIGKTSEDYTAIAINLGRQIKVDEERIKELGVKTRDAAGNFLPMQTVMQNAFETMQAYKVGVDQNEFALEAFGRSAKDVYDYFDLNAQVMERAAALQKELGIEMGPEKRAAIKAYSQDVRAMGIVWGGVRQSLGEQLMPILKNLTGWFAQTAPAAMSVMGVALKSVITALEFFGSIVATVMIAATAAVFGVVNAVKSLGEIFMAIVQNRWGDIPGIIKKGNETMLADGKAAADGIAAAWKSSYDRVEKVWSTPPAGAPGAEPKSGGTRTWTAKPKGGAEKDDRMQVWEAELKAQRDAFERMKLEQGSFERWSEEQTSNYWSAILSTMSAADSKRMAVTSKYYDAERTVRQKSFEGMLANLEREKQSIKYNYDERIRIAEEQARLIAQAYGASSKEAMAAEARVTAEYERQAEQRMRIAEIERRSVDARADHEVTMARLVVDQQVALRNVSIEQALVAEEGLQNRLYAIKAAALQREIALEAAGPNDPTKIAALNAQLESLEMSHQERLTEIHNRAELERQQYAIAASQALEQQFGNVLQGLVSGTKKWTDVLRDGIKALTADLNQIASKQIAKMLLGPGTEGGGIAGKLFGKIFGGGGDAAAGGEAAASQAVTSAKTAEASASSLVTSAATAQSTTASALTLTMTALTTAAESATAALMSVGSSGGGGGLGSLFGGGGGGSSMLDMFGEGTALAGYAVGTPYVPQDGLAMLHRGEAVIPSKYNKGGGAGGGSLSQQFVISGPVDTRTQYQIAEAAARGARLAGMRAGG
jgi:hypothetical protein